MPDEANEHSQPGFGIRVFLLLDWLPSTAIEPSLPKRSVIPPVTRSHLQQTWWKQGGPRGVAADTVGKERPHRICHHVKAGRYSGHMYDVDHTQK